MKEETPPRCHRRSFVAAAVDRRKSEIRESCEGRASPEESLAPLPPLYPPPLLVVLNCCTVVATVRVTGNVAVITGTTIGVTVISVQSIELRLCLEAVAAAETVGIDAVAVE
ncbi:uncharacterized protein DS421_13g400450 [Arachis hypogaea]|nr:uncharacterized protein DS421_13g400450 [Arachis hypogaea]